MIITTLKSNEKYFYLERLEELRIQTGQKTMVYELNTTNYYQTLLSKKYYTEVDFAFNMKTNKIGKDKKAFVDLEHKEQLVLMVEPFRMFDQLLGISDKTGDVYRDKTGDAYSESAPHYWFMQYLTFIIQNLKFKKTMIIILDHSLTSVQHDTITQFFKENLCTNLNIKTINGVVIKKLDLGAEDLIENQTKSLSLKEMMMLKKTKDSNIQCISVNAQKAQQNKLVFSAATIIPELDEEAFFKSQKRTPSESDNNKIALMARNIVNNKILCDIVAFVDNNDDTQTSVIYIIHERFFYTPQDPRDFYFVMRDIVIKLKKMYGDIHVMEQDDFVLNILQQREAKIAVISFSSDKRTLEMIASLNIDCIIVPRTEYEDQWFFKGGCGDQEIKLCVTQYLQQLSTHRALQLLDEIKINEIDVRGMQEDDDIAKGDYHNQIKLPNRELQCLMGSMIPVIYQKGITDIDTLCEETKQQNDMNNKRTLFTGPDDKFGLVLDDEQLRELFKESLQKKMLFQANKIGKVMRAMKMKPIDFEVETRYSTKIKKHKLRKTQRSSKTLTNVMQPASIAGRIDCVARNENTGKLHVFEFKYVSRLTYYHYLQPALYYHIVSQRQSPNVKKEELKDMAQKLSTRTYLFNVKKTQLIEVSVPRSGFKGLDLKLNFAS